MKTSSKHANRPMVVVLTGAGVSAESGIKTFRDNNGLWEEYNVMDVATPEAWKANPELVTRFYNLRRVQLGTVKPNPAHQALAELEKHFPVQIITQNVDDLHERAGSSAVMHLHGELTKMRSTVYPADVYDVGYREVEADARCAKGTVLRPHIVWFGEEVPLISEAVEWVSKADILLVIGTSLNVYPAAGLLHYAPRRSEKYLIDPGEHNPGGIPGLVFIQERAGVAMPLLAEKLIRKYADD